MEWLQRFNASIIPEKAYVLVSIKVAYWNNAFGTLFTSMIKLNR